MLIEISANFWMFCQNLIPLLLGHVILCQYFAKDLRFETLKHFHVLIEICVEVKLILLHFGHIVS